MATLGDAATREQVETFADANELKPKDDVQPLETVSANFQEDTSKPSQEIDVESLGEAPPVDKNNLTYYALCLLGVTCLLVFYAELNVTPFMKEQFQLQDETKTYIPALFQWSQPFAIGIQLVFVAAPNLLSIRTKIYVGFACMLTVFTTFSLTSVLSKLDNTKNKVPLWCNLTIGLAGMATGILQSAMSSYASHFPGEYKFVPFTGLAVAGLISSVISLICTSAGSANFTMILNFSISGLLILTSLLLFYISEKSEFSQYYLANSHKARPLKYSEIWVVFKACWVQGLLVFFGYFTTFLVYPGAIPTSEPGAEDAWIRCWRFVVIVATYNVFEFSGRKLTELVHLNECSLFKPDKIWTLIMLRLAVILPLMFHKHIEQRVGALTYQILVTLMLSLVALSAGTLFNLLMAYGPMTVEEDVQKDYAGVIVSIILNCGICIAGFTEPLISEAIARTA